MSELLTIENLRVDIPVEKGMLHAVRGIDLSVRAGETLSIVGESGSGKSLTALAIVGLLPRRAIRTAQRMIFDNTDLMSLSPRALEDLRGRRIGMIFQDPMTALNPVMTVARQMADIQYRSAIPATEKRARAVAMLARVGIPDAAQRIDGYAHHFSGGQRQRIAIAMALLMRPSLLIADEPTTALDVTLEAQIVHLLKSLRAEIDGAILVVSHNLGVIAELCDEVAVMYAGEIVEIGRTADVFAAPHHPYTAALLRSAPDETGPPPEGIPGIVPPPMELPPGCLFAPRCARRQPACEVRRPALETIEDGWQTRCIRWREA
jgi:oligopeptide/dipeptide ABC transporter ATP-binding protein